MKEVISTECVVIGGGIIGLAIGSELARNGKKIILLEKEDYLCQHTSSRNSEVIHSGIYYKPDSLKASLCKEGNELLYQYCNEKGIRHNPIGKMIIGDKNSEEYLQQLINNGKRNNVKGLKVGVPKEYRVDNMPKEVDDLWQEGIKILNEEISEVFLTCVPPQNSTDHAFLLPSTLFPIDTTLTSSPYFSPNRAIAPVFAASVGVIISVTTLSLQKIL